MDGDQVPLLSLSAVTTSAAAGGGVGAGAGAGGGGAAASTLEPVPPPSHQIHFFPAAPVLHVSGAGAGAGSPSLHQLHHQHQHQPPSLHLPFHHHHQLQQQQQPQIQLHHGRAAGAASAFPGAQFFHTASAIPSNSMGGGGAGGVTYDDPSFLSSSPVPLPPSSTGEFEMRQLGIAEPMLSINNATSSNIINNNNGGASSLLHECDDVGSSGGTDELEFATSSSLDAELLGGGGGSNGHLLGIGHRRCASASALPSGVAECGTPVARLSSDGSQTVVLVSALRTSSSARKKLRVSWIDDLGKPLHEVATVPRSWDRTPVLSEVMQRKFARARQERQRFVAICCGVFICLFVTAIGIVTVLLRLFLS